jgi:hypothetical protein
VVQVEKQTETEAAGPPAPRPRWKAFLSGAAWGGGLCFLAALVLVELKVGEAMREAIPWDRAWGDPMRTGWFRPPGRLMCWVVTFLWMLPRVLLMTTAGAALGVRYARPGGPAGLVLSWLPSFLCWMEFDDWYVVTRLLEGESVRAWDLGNMVSVSGYVIMFVIVPALLGGSIAQRKDKGLSVWG